MNRLAVSLAAAALSIAPGLAAADAAKLFKSPNCTCCDEYADYLRGNGYEVEVIPTHDLPGVKAENDVPDELAGCHTMLIDGYLFEGHVPVDSVGRVLEAEPPIAGISVPGMPQGSPGMSGDLQKPLRVWTIPAASEEKPKVHATYHRIPQ